MEVNHNLVCGFVHAMAGASKSHLKSACMGYQYSYDNLSTPPAIGCGGSYICRYAQYIIIFGHYVKDIVKQVC